MAESVPANRPRPTDGSNPFTASVFILFFIALFSSTAISAVEWTSLSYLTSIGFASENDISFYLTVSAIANFAPVLFNPLLGRLSAAHGSIVSLRITLSVVTVGLLAIVVNRASRLVFLLGWTCYAAINALRLVRIGFLAELVAPRHRTKVLAVHQIMAPVGFATGPLLWIALQKFFSPSVMLGPLTADTFSMLHGSMFFFACLGVLACIFLLRGPRGTVEDFPSAQNSPLSSSPSYGTTRRADISSPEQDSENTSQTFEVRQELKKYVIVSMLVAARFTSSMAVIAYQPLMVNKFNVDDEKMGQYYVLSSIFNFLPPLASAYLSQHLQDRRIMQIGITMKCVAGLLFLSCIGPMYEWQVAIGYALVFAGGSLFTPATISLFTKCYSGRSFSKLLGIAWSLSAGIPATVQLLLKTQVTETFGSWGFIIFLLPAFSVFSAILLPDVWRMLEESTTAA